MAPFSLPCSKVRRASVLYNFVCFLWRFLWSKHTVYTACCFQIFIEFVINIRFFSIRYQDFYIFKRIYFLHLVRSKTEIDGSILERLKQFNYLGCEMSLDGDPHFDKKKTDFKE